MYGLFPHYPKSEERLHGGRTVAIQGSSKKGIPNYLIKFVFSSIIARHCFYEIAPPLPHSWWIISSSAPQIILSRSQTSQRFVAVFVARSIRAMFCLWDYLRNSLFWNIKPHERRGLCLALFSAPSLWHLVDSGSFLGWRWVNGTQCWLHGIPHSCHSQEIRNRSWWLFTAWRPCTSLWTCMRWLKTAT